MRKLLNVSYKTHSLYLPLIVEDWSMQTQIHRRYLKFFNSVVHSTRVIHMCKLLVVNGSGSSVCKSLNHIRSLYNINGNREHSIQISSIKDVFDIDEQDKIIMLKTSNAY